MMKSYRSQCLKRLRKKSASLSDRGDAAEREKISIPRDLSVVGFDDIRLAQFVLPPLTTVRMSQWELARLAFEALLAEVQRETPAPNGTEYHLETDPGAAGVYRAGARFAGAGATE